jgi:hypothetical protein
MGNLGMGGMGTQQSNGMLPQNGGQDVFQAQLAQGIFGGPQQSGLGAPQQSQQNPYQNYSTPVAQSSPVQYSTGVPQPVNQGQFASQNPYSQLLLPPQNTMQQAIGYGGQPQQSPFSQLPTVPSIGGFGQPQQSPYQGGQQSTHSPYQGFFGSLGMNNVGNMGSMGSVGGMGIGNMGSAGGMGAAGTAGGMAAGMGSKSFAGGPGGAGSIGGVQSMADGGSTGGDSISAQNQNWGGWAPGQQAALSGNTGQQYGTGNWGYGQSGIDFGQNYANQFQTNQQKNNNPGQLTDAALAQFGQNPNMTQEQMQQIVNGTPGTSGTPAGTGLDGAVGVPATAGTPSMDTINNLGYYRGLNPNQLGNLQNYLSGPAGGSSLMKDPFKVNYGTPGVNLGSGLGTIYDMPSM